MQRLITWLSWAILSTSSLSLIFGWILSIFFPTGEWAIFSMFVFTLLFAVCCLPSFLSIYLKDYLKSRPLISLGLFILNFYLLFEAVPFLIDIWGSFLRYLEYP